MVVFGFQNTVSSLVYLFGLAALGFHLSHGIHSALQTLGLLTRDTLFIWSKAAFVIAAAFFFAYISIPACVLVGMVK
ncbi:MAG: succinate dehydrogenase (or fumarate reductase) cytochrome b subunit, b558 family [Firmicutes bacterium]|nr:succinate dehydrogenase (or fumarate reductase) cytochrome b subunit, b558 family [Bacillota bacterium]